MRFRVVLVLSVWINFIECVFFDHFTLDHMVGIQSGRAQLWNETDQDKLKKDLFANYDRFSRPDEHFNATKVKFGVSILHLESDERKSTVTVHSWLRMIWNDPKLQWNESDYGDVSVLRIADHEVWHPDLYLYNSASGGEPLIRFGAPNVLVYPNGEVLFVPPSEQKVLCEFDLRYWPFDTQHCKLKYGSWVHHGYEIELSLYNNEESIDLSDLLLLNTWNITHTSGEVVVTTYPCCPEPYSAVVFNFTMTRNSHTYTAVVITPCVVNTLIILAQFWLPTKSSQRLYLNGFLLVILSSYLLHFVDHFSGIGKSTPIIVQFYANSLCIVCLGLITNMAIAIISQSRKLKIVELYARKVFGGRTARILLINTDNVPLTHRNKKLVADDFTDEEARLCEHIDQDTPFLAVLMDRLLFIIYLLATLCVGLQFKFS